MTNMFGARPYVQREFGVSGEEAGAILSDWMKTFSQRMKIIIKCECGEILETSTAYDIRICMKCGRRYIVPKLMGLGRR